MSDNPGEPPEPLVAPDRQDWLASEAASRVTQRLVQRTIDVLKAHRPQGMPLAPDEIMAATELLEHEARDPGEGEPSLPPDWRLTVLSDPICRDDTGGGEPHLEFHLFDADGRERAGGSFASTPLRRKRQTTGAAYSPDGA